MNDTKKLFIQNKIQNCGRDSRKMYKIINKLIGRNRRSDVSYNLVFNNIGTDDPSSIADYFNEHFVNVADEIASKLPQISFPSSNYAEEQSVMLHETNVVEVLSQIASLKNSFSYGVDLITNTVIKRFDRTLAPFLVNYINESFLSGVFQNSLKRATIQPHFETGSKTDANNYRPISILPSFGKVFEKIMKIKTLNYIEKFKILGENQFGFRNRRSTVDALVNVVENIRLEKEKGNNSTTVFLGLKKAFDTVNHSLLLTKFENFGIGGQVLSWFSSYLKSRTQCVIWKNRISKELIVKNGVPQGSVLGPVLFILYFNDFVDACKLSTPYFFADDTSLFFKSRPTSEELITEIHSVSHWLHQNKLDLNESKTFVMNFFETNAYTNIQNCPVQKCNTYKYLGVILDANLIFEKCGIHLFKIKEVNRNNCKAKENLQSQHRFDVLQNYSGSKFWVWTSYLWWNNVE